MRYRIKQGLHTLRLAHAFLSTRQYRVALGDLTPHIEHLGAVVERLQTHAGEQETSTRRMVELTGRRRALARSLRREFLYPLSQLGSTLFLDHPTHADLYRMTKARDDEGLLQAANAVAERLAQDIERFAERGISPELPNRLRATAAAFREAITDGGHERARRVAATQGLRMEMSRGYAAIKLIGTLIVPHLERDAGQMAEWRSASRFVRRRVVEGGGEDQDVVDKAA